MNIKIGDTVRFLNDIGGGKVVGFNGKGQVIVEQEDGFGFPIATDECVVVSSAEGGSQGKSTASKVEPKDKIVAKKASAVVFSAQSAQSYGNQLRSPERLTVFLAFAPTDIEQLEYSHFDLYLINDSDYTLFFSLFEAIDGGCKCRKSSFVEPHENLFVEQVKHSNIESLEHLRVQVMALKGSGKFVAHSPIDKEINTRLVKFVKQSSYSDSPFLGCPALSIELTKDTVQLEIEALKESLSQKDIPSQATSSENKKKTASKSEMLEIDLHIDSLLDSTRGMSNGEMLEYQIGHFKKIMAENERYTGKKIVFIHGKGDGVLRSALERELKRMGKGNRYQQASFKKYGYGAIMVII